MAGPRKQPNKRAHGKRSPGAQGRKSSDNARKGALVEVIVGMLHDLPGVKVERNVRLPPVHGDSSRSREIDVLLTSYVAGYPVRIAFSCKNERAKVKPGAIGEFIDELDDVGIPLQHGIFVCVNGYTSGALDRAKEKGIRALLLKGLTKSRLTSEISEAFQFNVNLLAEVLTATVTNNVSAAEYDGQFFLFFDNANKPCGTLLDLILAWWQQQDASITLGRHDISLEVPSGWYQFVDSKPEPVIGVSAVVQVTGLIITLSGRLKRHALVNPSKRIVERSQINVEFDVPRKKKIELPLKAVSTERDLEAFTLRPGHSRVLSRIKLPRILYYSFYYPLSARTSRLIIERFKKFEAGEIADPRAFSLEETEGSDLSSIWEPPWYDAHESDGPPVIVTDDEANNVDVRLLMRAGEYSRVTALYPRFLRLPTPEFAYLLYWAFLMHGNSLIRKAKSHNKSASQRLIEEGIEKIKTAIQINPDKADAHINLGSALHSRGRFQDALASYDRAIQLDDSDHQAWANRTTTLISLGREEEALSSITNSVKRAATPNLQVTPMLMRSYVHHRAGRDSDAAEDLVAAWQINDAEVMADVDHNPLFEAICRRFQIPETILLLSELYWTQAANQTFGLNGGLAKEKVDSALATLRTLKPLNQDDSTLVPGKVSGGLVYDVLTRSATRLAEAGNTELAKESIEQMQEWAVSLFGEGFDSLSGLLTQLSIR